MMSLPHHLDRTVTIQATRETVFRFFTDDARWAAWWGAGSTIDPQPGGQVLIRYPNGIEASGEVLEVRPPERIVFTYGYASRQPIPPGSSRVTIRLEAFEGGTRLNLLHEFAEAAVRDEHVQGWRYQLSVFGNVVADEIHAGAAGLADAWFRAWSATATDERERILAVVAAPHVRFRDRFGLIDGVPDLISHVDAMQRFMPGVRLERRGEVRHCQGTALVDWVGVGGDGQERGSGTNVFIFGADGLIESVTGFWNART
jgi:uncharacterized protein YndB with AHSA1/START domain